MYTSERHTNPMFWHINFLEYADVLEVVLPIWRELNINCMSLQDIYSSSFRKPFIIEYVVTPHTFSITRDTIEQVFGEPLEDYKVYRKEATWAGRNGRKDMSFKDGDFKFTLELPDYGQTWRIKV